MNLPITPILLEKREETDHESACDCYSAEESGWTTNTPRDSFHLYGNGRTPNPPLSATFQQRRPTINPPLTLTLLEMGRTVKLPPSTALLDSIHSHRTFPVLRVDAGRLGQGLRSSERRAGEVPGADPDPRREVEPQLAGRPRLVRAETAA